MCEGVAVFRQDNLLIPMLFKTFTFCLSYMFLLSFKKYCIETLFTSVTGFFGASVNSVS